MSYPARKKGRAPRAGKRKQPSKHSAGRPVAASQPLCEGVTGDFHLDDLGYALGYDDYESEEAEDQWEDDDDWEDAMVAEDTSGAPSSKPSSISVQAVLDAAAEEDRLARQRPTLSLDSPEFEALNEIVSIAAVYLGVKAAAPGGLSAIVRLTPRGVPPHEAPPQLGCPPVKLLDRRDMLCKRRRVEAIGSSTQPA